jgi:WD40 repeat protein
VMLQQSQKTMSLPAAVTEEIRAIRPYCKFEGHTDEVRGIIHLSCEQQFMTCSLDGSLRVWNLQTGKQIGNDWWDGEGHVFTIALSLDETSVKPLWVVWHCTVPYGGLGSQGSPPLHSKDTALYSFRTQLPSTAQCSRLR